MKNIFKRLFLVTSLFTMSFYLKGEDPKTSYLRIPPMKKPPQIDGKINADEWRDAAESFGCLQIRTNYLAGRDAVFYIGYDSNNIYFACKSELPPKEIELLSRVRKRDGKVYIDDSVEFLLMPPHKELVYQLIVNSLGTFFDIKYPVQRGNVCHSEHKAWNPNAKSASSFRDGNWELETLIPLKDLGVETLPFGKEWRVQMTRDWRHPAQPAPWNKSSQFCNPDSMGIMVMDKNAPAVHFKGLGGDYRKGEFSIELAVYNGTESGKKVECNVDVVSDGPPRAMNSIKSIEPEKSDNFVLKYSESSEITRDLSAQVKDLSTGKVLMYRNFKWESGKVSSWENPNAQKTAELDFAYYPSYKLIKCRVDFSSFKSKISDIVFYVQDQDGKKIGNDIKGKIYKKDYRAEWTLPELKEGKYNVVAKIKFADGKEMEMKKEFLVKHFPWEHNKIGLDDVIVPPYKPLKTDRGKREVAALMTSYSIKGLFWDKIFSQGENILSAPVRLIINGENVLKEKKFEFKDLRDSSVKAEMRVAGNGIEIKGLHEYDYDGMCKVSLDILPQKETEIESAWLEIPLKKSVARLMHTMHNTMKKHPADFIPEGEGVVWNSTMGYQNDEIRGNFRPYFWMGWIYKGLCWFTASDKDWSLDYEKPAIEVIRKNDAVVLRINIVNKPCVWKEPFKYVMGFQATPVKPRMKGWRRLSERVKYKAESSIAIATLAGSAIWGSDGSYDPWPANKDYSMTKRLSKATRKEAAKETSDVDAFISKHFSNVSKPRHDFIKRHLLRGRGWGRFCEFFAPYLNPTASEMSWEEYKVYMDEWWYSDYRANASDDYNTEPCKSYQDMFLYYTQKLVRNGMDGIYYDNIRDRTSYDTTTGPAHELEDGKIQPYFDFFSVRQLLKRTYTMLYLEGKTILDDRPFLIAHMTNTNVVPYMSFATITLDLEAKFGPADFQDRFSEGWLLSTTIGTQTGCAPEVLVQVTGNEKEFVTRTFLAVTLAYDLPIVMNCGGLTSTFTKTWGKFRDFGYGSKDVDVFTCWDEKNPLKVLTKSARCALYLKKEAKEALVIVSDFGEGGTVSVDVEGVGFAPLEVRNFETGQPIKLKENKIETELKKHDFKIFILKGKE
jgi:hypothetical protein